MILEDVETKSFFFSHISQVPEGNFKNHDTFFKAICTPKIKC